MYINNTNAFYQTNQQEVTYNTPVQESRKSKTLENYLKNFSEKAQLTFDSLTANLSQEKTNELTQTLNSIGKAAAFASMNGFDRQDERLVVSQYFGNFDGVLSDDAIKNMIFSKLNNPNQENREFLQDFAQALDEPLKSIDITV